MEAGTLTGWQGASITPFLVMGVQIALRLEGWYFKSTIGFFEGLSLIFNQQYNTMGLGVCLSHCLQSCDCVVGLQEQEVIFSSTKLHNTVLNTAFFCHDII